MSKHLTAVKLFLRAQKALMLLVFIGLGLLLQSTASAAIQLAAVRLSPYDSTEYIVPWDDNRPLAEALQAYTESVRASAELNALLMMEQQIGRWSNPAAITPLKSIKSKKPKAIIVANQASDLGEHRVDGLSYNRINNFSQPLAARDFKVFTLPVGVTLRLNDVDGAEFLKKLNESFSLMVHLGGDDIDPRLFGESVTFAKVVSPLRDQLELEIAQSYIKAEKGFSFGVCRGHQMLALAQGARLHQDLQSDGVTKVVHGNLTQGFDGSHSKAVYHDVIFNPQAVHSKLFPRQWQVNSIHHQAVDLISLQGSRFLKILAVSTDGVVEAIEFKNHRGLSFQFHPELMYGSQVFNTSFNIVTQLAIAKSKKSQACRLIF